MARPGKPWWWESRGRWAATIDGRRRVAPKTIGRKDQHKAWAWHAKVSQETVEVDAATVQGLCEAYLQWDERRVAMGDRDAAAHRSSCYRYQKICDTQLADGRFGDMEVGLIRADHADGLIVQWKLDGVSESYRRELLGSMKTTFAWAAKRVDGRDRLIPESPFAGVKLPVTSPPAERYAERSEAAAWLRWLWRKGLRDYALLQRCLIHTGARPSELVRATWEEIRWNVGSNGMAVLTRRDWKSARRTGKVRRVFLPRRLHRMLRRRMADATLTSRLFSSPRGLAWTPNNLSTTTSRFRGEAIKDDLRLTDEGPDRLTCYRWRHTAASTLLMNGVSVSTVAELLGTSAKQIERTYGHLLSDHLAEAADLVSRRS